MPASYGLGDALNNLGRPQDALAVFEKILAAHSDDAMAYLGIGDAWKSIGRLQEARSAYEHAVALAPKSAVCHRFLAEAGRFTEGDPRLAALEGLARDVSKRSPKTKGPISISRSPKPMTNCSASAGVDCLQKANALKRRLVVYDEAVHLDELRRIAAVFAARITRRSQWCRRSFGAAGNHRRHAAFSAPLWSNKSWRATARCSVPAN